MSASMPLELPYPGLSGDEILLYVGEVQLSFGDQSLATEGAIVLDLGRSELIVRYTPTTAFAFVPLLSSHMCEARLSTGSSLDPPGSEADVPAFTTSMPINAMEYGTPEDTRVFEAYVLGDLTDQPLGEVDGAQGLEPQLTFDLLGWHVTLATVQVESSVIHLVRATAEQSSNAEQLRDALFLLFTLTAGREIAVGPGLARNSAGGVTWVSWGPPRTTIKRNNVRWCPPHLVPEALLLLAPGFGEAISDPTAALVLRRAVQAIPFAGSSEVLDVRIPIVCSAIELLAWVVLIREGWATEASLNRMDASTMMRLLARWAGIPAGIPDSATALQDRVSRIGEAGWEAPEVLFNVRNRLVHPPKRAASPEWPTGDELFESWQVGTWFLELVLLRMSNYSGRYWSRLRLGRYAKDTEPVPWA